MSRAGRATGGVRRRGTHGQRRTLAAIIRGARTRSADAIPYLVTLALITLAVFVLVRAAPRGKAAANGTAGLMPGAGSVKSAGTVKASAEAQDPTPVTGLVTFTDTVRQTSFSVQTSGDDPNAGVFTFETPSAVQYHGGGLADLQRNGNGTVGIHYEGTVQVLTPTPDGSDMTTTTATMHLNATLDLRQLRATAEMMDTGTQQHYVMITGTPPDAMPAVHTYDNAAMIQDWATLYALTSQDVVGQYTEAQFAQVMAQQVQSAGAVTAITVTGTPQVVTNPAGMTYFTITEQVTMTLNGTAQTQPMTNVFILENGVWKFWFTKVG